MATKPLVSGKGEWGWCHTTLAYNDETCNVWTKHVMCEQLDHVNP